MIPGIKEYVEFTSPKAIGSEGYLLDKGLIPLPDGERAKFEKMGRHLLNLTLKC